MDNTAKVEYRGDIIALDENEYQLYKRNRGRYINSIDIDQYLLNNVDKTGIDPDNVDFNIVKSRYTIKEIEQTVNEYLKTENKAWK